MNATPDDEADADAAQQIGEHDRHDGDDERDEVAAAETPGVPPQRRRGKAEAGTSSTEAMAASGMRLSTAANASTATSINARVHASPTGATGRRHRCWPTTGS